jgi:hypothetical protein
MTQFITPGQSPDERERIASMDTARVRAVAIDELPTDKVRSVPTLILPAVAGAAPLFDTDIFGKLHIMARRDRLSPREFERRLHLAEWQRRVIWREEEAMR